MESRVINGSVSLVLDPRRPGPDYLLRWPRELLVYEAKALAGEVAGRLARTGAAAP